MISKGFNLLFSIILFPLYLCGIAGAWVAGGTSKGKWMLSGILNYPENPYIDKQYFGVFENAK